MMNPLFDPTVLFATGNRDTQDALIASRPDPEHVELIQLIDGEPSVSRLTAEQAAALGLALVAAFQTEAARIVAMNGMQPAGTA